MGVSMCGVRVERAGVMLAAHPATARMTLSPSTRWKRQIGMVISAGMWQQIAGSSPVRAQR